MKCGLYLQGGLYSEMAFNTGLTVCVNLFLLVCFQWKNIEEKPVKIDKWDTAALKNSLDDGAKKV